MFIVQGIIRLLQDPESARAGDEAYDALLHDTEGMYLNLYLERVSDPTLTVHAMFWKEQATSEEFGVSPGFMALRQRAPIGTRNVLEGPLSPGYWRPAVTAEYAPPPTGYDRTRLGAATHAMVFVQPGKEAEYVAAEQKTADALKAIDGVYWFRAYQNLGRVNAFSRLIHWRDLAAAEAGIAALGDAEAARRALVIDEQGGPCYVKLVSDWPERRAKDGF